MTWSGVGLRFRTNTVSNRRYLNVEGTAARCRNRPTGIRGWAVVVSVKTGERVALPWKRAIKTLTDLDVTPSESRRIRALWRAKMLAALRREAVPEMRDQ